MKRSIFVVLAVGCGGGKPAQPNVPAQPAPPPLVAPAPAPAPVPPAKPLGHPRSDLIPRGVLFGNSERGNVQLSSDGAYLSWIAARDGVMNVFVAPRDHLDRARPVTADKTRPVFRYFWAFDNKHILYLQDAAGDENFHLYRADLEGHVVDLTPFPKTRVEVLGLSEKRRTTVMVEMNDRDPAAMDVYRLDVETAKRTRVYENKDQAVGFTFDPELELAIVQRVLPDGSAQWLRPKGKAWEVFETIPFEDADTTAIVDVRPGGKVAYVQDSRGHDTSVLGTIDLATKKVTVLAEDPRSDVAGVLFTPTSHVVRAVAFDTGKPTWRALDKAVEADLAALTALAEGGRFRIASMTLDDRLWLVATDRPQHPGHYFLYDRAKKHGTFLFATRADLDQQPLVDMQVVTIKTRDGLDMVSYLTRPRDATQPVPLVVFPHGGPWARDEWGFDPFAQLLANRGYAVLQPNFRASTGFGKQFLNAGNGEWNRKMQDDLVDAVEWAIAQGITTRDRVAIMGGSYGGYATLAALTRDPELFRCGVDLFGPSNLLTLIETIPPYWAPILASFKKKIGDWDTPVGKELLRAASPLTHATAIRRPLLIGQGQNDPRVKPAESEQIVAAMKQAKLPVSYLLFPDEGHGFARPENNIAFAGVAEAFLSVHLGGSYLPLTDDEVKATSMKVVEGAADVPGLTR